MVLDLISNEMYESNGSVQFPMQFERINFNILSSLVSMFRPTWIPGIELEPATLLCVKPVYEAKDELNTIVNT